MELTSRFELPTSSLPMMCATYCATLAYLGCFLFDFYTILTLFSHFDIFTSFPNLLNLFIYKGFMPFLYTHYLNFTKAVRYLLRHISILKFQCIFCCFLSAKKCHFLFYQGCALPAAPHKHGREILSVLIKVA